MLDEKLENIRKDADGDAKKLVRYVLISIRLRFGYLLINSPGLSATFLSRTRRSTARRTTKSRTFRTRSTRSRRKSTTSSKSTRWILPRPLNLKTSLVTLGECLDGLNRMFLVDVLLRNDMHLLIHTTRAPEINIY